MSKKKIAVTTEQGQIFQHFGKCAQFTLYTVENGEVIDKKLLDATGSGHSALAGFLHENGADLVICGGIGAGAKEALAKAGMELICGVSGSVEDAVHAYLNHTLVGNPNYTCDHHHGGEEGAHHCHSSGGCGGGCGHHHG